MLPVRSPADTATGSDPGTVDGIVAIPHPLSMRVRLTRLVVSWLLVGVGVPMLIRADLGVAPFDVLTTGVSDRSGWSLGFAFVLCSAVFFGSGALLGARLGPACVGGTLVVGVLVNLALRTLPEASTWPVRATLLAAGIAIIATAICLVVTTEFGPGPTEVLMLGLVHRRLGVVPARWLSDGIPLVLGVAAGGSFGIGTVTFLAVMGPAVKYGLRRLRYEPPHLRLAAARLATAAPSPTAT